jgi:hypothetical protein
MAYPSQAKNKHSRPSKRKNDPNEVNSLQLNLPIALNLFQGHQKDRTKSGQRTNDHVQPEDPPPRLLSFRGERSSNDGTDTVGNSNHEPRIPWYLPRSLRGTTSLTIIWATLTKPPPATPVSARKTISWVAVLDTDAPKEPMKKIPSPMRRMTFRDQMSDTQP